MQPRPPSTHPRASWLLFAGFALLYMATAARTVQGGDSGEFVTVAALGGVPHPSGYPLFTLLSRLVVVCLPFGSVAWKVAALSGVLGAAALGVLHRAILRATNDDFGALVGACALGFSPLFWRWSVVQEVLSGACLTAALVLLVAVRAARGERGPLQGLLLGLSFATGIAHHHTAILLAPLLLYALLASVPRPRSFRGGVPVLGAAVAGAALGFLPYLLFLGDGGAWRWGETESFAGLVHHFFRGDYGTFDTGQPDRAVPLAEQPLLYLRGLGLQFPGLLVALGVVGLRFAFRLQTGGRFALALLGTWILAGPVFVLGFDLPAVGYYRVVVERFHPFPNVFAAMLVGIGATGLCRLSFWSTRALPRLLLFLNLGLACWLALPHAVMSGATVAEDFISNTLGAVDENALVLAQGDGFYYGCLQAQEVEGLRPDVACVKPGMLRFPWYRAWLAERHPGLVTVVDGAALDFIGLVGANLSNRPVYLSVRALLTHPGTIRHLPPVWPEAGTLLRVASTGVLPPPPAQVEARLLQDWRGFEVRSRIEDMAELDESLEYPLWDHYGLAWSALVPAYEATGDPSGRERAIDCVARLTPWLLGEGQEGGATRERCPLFAPGSGPE
ncbi:MAG: DUF2723 domain-containing protein [Myxococcota bacterium]|nr:DUF2723 domain-containing protein [Myxococcota bacterium]